VSCQDFWLISSNFGCMCTQSGRAWPNSPKKRYSSNEFAMPLRLLRFILHNATPEGYSSTTCSPHFARLCEREEINWSKSRHYARRKSTLNFEFPKKLTRFTKSSSGPYLTIRVCDSMSNISQPTESSRL
jgi:hypothetical protein